MHDTQFRLLTDILDEMSQSLTQLVHFEKLRLEKQHMLTRDSVDKLIAAIIALTALVKASSGDHQARLDAEKALADLKSSDAALNDPQLDQAVSDALAAASDALPPAAPTEPVTPPNPNSPSGQP